MTEEPKQPSEQDKRLFLVAENIRLERENAELCTRLAWWEKREADVVEPLRMSVLRYRWASDEQRDAVSELDVWPIDHPYPGEDL